MSMRRQQASPHMLVVALMLEGADVATSAHAVALIFLAMRNSITRVLTTVSASRACFSLDAAFATHLCSRALSTHVRHKMCLLTRCGCPMELRMVNCMEHDPDGQLHGACPCKDDQLHGACSRACCSMELRMERGLEERWCMGLERVG
jgi:hypothetical protein